MYVPYKVRNMYCIIVNYTHKHCCQAAETWLHCARNANSYACCASCDTLDCAWNPMSRDLNWFLFHACACCCCCCMANNCVFVLLFFLLTFLNGSIKYLWLKWILWTYYVIARNRIKTVIWCIVEFISGDCHYGFTHSVHQFFSIICSHFLSFRCNEFIYIIVSATVWAPAPKLVRVFICIARNQFKRIFQFLSCWSFFSTICCARPLKLQSHCECVKILHRAQWLIGIIFFSTCFRRHNNHGLPFDRNNFFLLSFYYHFIFLHFFKFTQTH